MFFWLKVGLIVAAIAAVAFAKHSYDERRRDEGRVEVRHDEVAPLQARLDAAYKRATDLALLWAASLDKLQDESRKRQEAERERTEAFAQRAAALSRAPTIVISPAAARLWGDITPIGTEPAKGGDAPKPAARAEAFSESALVGFVNAAKAAYDDAVGLFHDARKALQECLSAIASTQPKEATP